MASQSIRKIGIVDAGGQTKWLLSERQFNIADLQTSIRKYSAA